MAIFLNFGLLGPNVETVSILPPLSPLPPKGKISSLFFAKTLLTIWHFQNGLIKHEEIKRTELVWTISTFDQVAQIWKLGPSSHKTGQILILFLLKILLTKFYSLNSRRLRKLNLWSWLKLTDIFQDFKSSVMILVSFFQCYQLP